jgi:hypothetical protein
MQRPLRKRRNVGAVKARLRNKIKFCHNRGGVRLSFNFSL